MASTDDILSAQKNLVVAVNSVNSTLASIFGTNGNNNSGEISAITLVQSGKTWLATVSVIVAGSTTGMIYDTTNTYSSALTGNRLCYIPMAVGIYVVKMPCLSGLVVSPGTGQVVNVSYT